MGAESESEGREIEGARLRRVPLIPALLSSRSISSSTGECGTTFVQGTQNSTTSLPLGQWLQRSPHLSPRGASGQLGAVVLVLVRINETGASPYIPTTRPSYQRPKIDPYTEPVGEDEQSGHEHLAGMLLAFLTSIDGQEVASHTFSRYYRLERGQTDEAFRADLKAAQAIAALRGDQLASLVFPETNGTQTTRAIRREWLQLFS